MHTYYARKEFKLKKFIYKIYYILFIFIMFLFTYSIPSFAAYPRLISTLITAFEEIKNWIIAISTPAVAVAVRNRRIYEKI